MQSCYRSRLYILESTTVDYVLMDVDAASSTSSCIVHEVACLNTSDHLRILVTVEVSERVSMNSTWTKAELSGGISEKSLLSRFHTIKIRFVQ